MGCWPWVGREWRRRCCLPVNRLPADIESGSTGARRIPPRFNRHTQITALPPGVNPSIRNRGLSSLVCVNAFNAWSVYDNYCSNCYDNPHAGLPRIIRRQIRFFCESVSRWLWFSGSLADREVRSHLKSDRRTFWAEGKGLQARAFMNEMNSIGFRPPVLRSPAGLLGIAFSLLTTLSPAMPWSTFELSFLACWMRRCIGQTARTGWAVRLTSPSFFTGRTRLRWRRHQRQLHRLSARESGRVIWDAISLFPECFRASRRVTESRSN